MDKTERRRENEEEVKFRASELRVEQVITTGVTGHVHLVSSWCLMRRGKDETRACN